MFRRSSVQENAKEMIFSQGDFKAILKKDEGWKKYRFTYFVKNIICEDKFELRIEQATKLADKHFSIKGLEYHEMMVKIFKNELNLEDFLNGHFLSDAIAINPKLNSFYYDYLDSFRAEFEAEIEADWENNDDYSFCTYKGYYMIVDCGRRNGYYFYGGTNKTNPEKSFSINSLGGVGSYRTEEEAKVAAETYIKLQDNNYTKKE